jgi:hypothetical protein
VPERHGGPDGASNGAGVRLLAITEVSRALASSRLLHVFRCVAGTYRRAAAARPLSKWRCRRIGGPHRRSGFPRSAHSAARRRAARGAGSPTAFVVAFDAAPARGSLSSESQYSAGRGASGAAVGGAGRRAASAASFSICLGVGMRQLAGRSVMPRLEHNKNKCRVRSKSGPKKRSRRRDEAVGTKAGGSS